MLKNFRLYLLVSVISLHLPLSLCAMMEDERHNPPPIPLHIDTFEEAERFLFWKGRNDLKEIGRQIIKRIAKQDGHEKQYDALRTLLRSYEEEDQIFSREQLFRNILNGSNDKKVESAKVLFQSFSTENNLIGARVLVSNKRVDLVGTELQFKAAETLSWRSSDEIDKEKARKVYRSLIFIR